MNCYGWQSIINKKLAYQHTKKMSSKTAQIFHSNFFYLYLIHLLATGASIAL